MLAATESHDLASGCRFHLVNKTTAKNSRDRAGMARFGPSFSWPSTDMIS